MRRTTIHLRSLLAAGALAVLATACRDSSVAPSQQRAMNLGQPVLTKNSTSTTFTYDPSYLFTYPLPGYHKISFEPYSVCDPAVTNYGPGTWDQDCVPLTHQITISATSSTDANGNAFVEFQPKLRFVPGRVVTLYMTDKKSNMSAFAKIMYCADNEKCVDESLKDPSLATYRSTKGQYYRRIKHFSGYNVVLGGECDLSLGDPDCIDMGDGTGLKWP